MLISIFLFLLLIRLLMVFGSVYTFYSDDAIYAFMANSWRIGAWQYVFHPFWPPLYPVISAFFLLFTSNFENASRLVSIIFGTAIVMPLFFLLRETTSKIEAIFFIISLSLFTTLITLSLLPLSDSLSIFLIISGIVSTFFAFIHLSDNLGKKFLLLSAFIFGLTYLTRSEGTMFFFLTLIYLISIGIFKYRTKQFFLSILYFVIIFFITISPYLIAVKWQIGEWSLSQKFSAQIQQGHAFSLNKRGTTWAQEIYSARTPNLKSPYFKNGTGYLIDHLSYFLHSYPQKQFQWQTVFLTVFPIWIIPFILIGATYLLNKKYIWSVVYLIFMLITAVPITIFSTAEHDIRYLSWTIPIFLYLFILGIKKIIHNSYVTVLLFIFAVILFPGTSIDNLFNPERVAINFSKFENKDELKEAGIWIKANSSHPNPKIMMRHEGVEYYSGGQTIYTPQISYNELIEYTKRNKVDYIVAWDEELAADKNLMELLDDKIEHPGLQKVHSFKGHGKIIIYKLIDL